jgi:Zn-dependent peptidase ImmA (M78 family)
VPSTVAHVTPEVLRWARESAGHDAAAAAQAAGLYHWQLDMAEEGQLDITLAQAEKLAEFYDRPLVDLFLPEPPDEPNEEALFRRLPGAPRPPWPPQMRKLARRVRGRQDAAAELYELLAELPPWLGSASRLRQIPDGELTEGVREILKIGLDEQLSWNDSRGYVALRAWVDAVEELGVLVMQDGSMDLAGMRGFASLHDTVPAIVLNTKDDPRARVFTLIHELGHLLRPDASEQWCNDFAGELLMPRETLRVRFMALAADDPIKGIGDLARAFSVTPYAAAVRIRRTNVMTGDRADHLIATVRSRQHPPARKGGGGHGARNKLTWLGPAFVRLVLSATDAQALPLSNAAGLLESKVDTFPGLRQLLEERAEIG